MVFQKKIALEYHLSRISGKDHVFFPQKYDLNLDGKWKMIFLKKKNMEIWYFLHAFWKDGLFKRGRAVKWSFLYYLERWYFFLENAIFFPRAGSQRWPSSRNTWKHDIFCVHVWVLQTWCHAPLPKKIKDGLIPQKYI